MRASRSKPEAWRLIEFLSRPEQQVRFYRLTGDLPARREAWQDTSLTRDPVALAFWEQLQRVRSTPKVPEWELVATRLLEKADLAIRGRVRPDRRSRARPRGDRILEKRRWLIERGGRPAHPWVSMTASRSGRARPSGWFFVGPRCPDRLFLFVPVIAGWCSPHDSTSTRSRTRHGARRLARHTRACSPTRCSGSARQHALFAWSRPVVGRDLARRRDARELEARAFSAAFRAIFFAPVVTTLVAVAIVWRYVYHPQYGL